ncbi:MAG TPA: HD domain-containing phosphohydrolase [Vicinamibacterales bacterium]|jgi:putative nucleotidyltransferase with HDIG domain
MSEKRNDGSLGFGARAYVFGVIAAGVAVAAYSVYDLIRHPVGMEWLILVGLTVVSGWASPRAPSMPISFSVSDTFNIVAALLFGPSAGAMNAALDGLVLTSRFSSSQRSLDRVLFNMAAPTIAIWIATHLFFALGGNRQPIEGALAALRLLAALTLFGAVDFGLNSGIVAIAVGFERRISVVSIWREHLSGVWITYFGGIFGAMLLMFLARFSVLEALILIVPLPVILYVTFRHAVGRATDQIDHLAKVNKVYVGAIEALAHAVDAKDEVTHDHTRRVQDRAVHLARSMGVDDEGEIQAIKAASLLHDVGKLAIPEHILNKPGRLTPAEYDIMKRHAPIGADILSVIGFPFAVAPIVRYHHENWDGTGYPDGIAGEDIPVGSRILAVVDCFDALTSDRPYRRKMEDREALQILSDRRGTMYDPRVVDTFFALHGSGFDMAPAPLPAGQRHSALQAPLRTGGDHHELDLQTFFEFGRALGAPVSMSELGEVVWSQFKTRLPASTFVLYGYDHADDSIVAVYEAGVDEYPVRTTRIPLGERLSGWVAATGQAVVNSDARLDLDDAARDRSALRSALAVPVVSNGRSIGVLSFYACEANAFDETHRKLIVAASLVLAPSLAEIADRGPKRVTAGPVLSER